MNVLTMRVELPSKDPDNLNKGHSKTPDKPVAEKKDSLKNIDKKEKEKKKIPLFYTTPIFRPNKYEFY